MHIHPPKRETFNVPAMVNVDPKGFERSVEVYQQTPFGLYMARPAPGHPTFHYLESWLLPTINLRVTNFHFFPQEVRDQRFYLDIGEVTHDQRRDIWHAEDHYLDLLERPGRPMELIDVDEIFAAFKEGHLSLAQCEAAVANSTRVMTGTAVHGYNFDHWLASQGINLSWQS